MREVIKAVIETLRLGGEVIACQVVDQHRHKTRKPKATTAKGYGISRLLFNLSGLSYPSPTQVLSKSSPGPTPLLPRVAAHPPATPPGLRITCQTWLFDAHELAG